ncbi:hypothetical protein DNTS_008326 [Danionella cerebrum]|uniref:C2H2-type domain-containing protein n=1 Tax=Danionella cerebrum TaxID=2873325 RepID=A0A553P5H1_9TELE|nr:hypothetical protein DNTS_008326 [Danionella translucida]
MPRSFLVKKYFSTRKPNYSELESQTAIPPFCLPLRDSPSSERAPVVLNCPSFLLWGTSTLPFSFTGVSVVSPVPQAPSTTSSSSSGDEDNLPSPESPRQISGGFICKHCTKEYSSLGALKMHIRSHSLPCVCGTCGKAFSRPWLLRGHIRTHTGERPFSCPHCSRAFADRSNLRAHLQTHTQLKRYQCVTCSRSFSRMSLLHKHTLSGGCPSA